MDLKHRIKAIKRNIIKANNELKDIKQDHWSWWIFPNSIIESDYSEYNMTVEDYNQIITWSIRDDSSYIYQLIKMFVGICNIIITNLIINKNTIEKIMKNNGPDVGKFLSAVYSFYLCFKINSEIYYSEFLNLYIYYVLIKIDLD